MVLGCRAVAEANPGLLATYQSGGITDLNRTANVQRFIPAGEPATPFVPIGSFSASWNGFISSELRAEYSFHFIARGKVKLTVSGNVVLDTEGTGEIPVVTEKPVRLSKGANPIKIDYTSPDTGDAFVRFYWSNRDTPFNPVPAATLTAEATPDFAKALQIHQGRDLVLEHRCVRCHAAVGALPELGMDAPSFQEIGSRRQTGWMASWIENPHAIRSGTSMPAVFTGKNASENASCIAAYLASLTGGAKRSSSQGNAVAGKALYETLHCIACHNPPGSTEAELGKISQRQVAVKFVPGALVPFLLRPEEHFAWIRMPNFGLTSEQAEDLAAYLLAAADKPDAQAVGAGPSGLEKGRRLVATSGCLNCHTLEGAKNEFTTRSLSELTGGKLNTGCLAEEPSSEPETRAPRFRFSAEQRAAVKAFLKTDRNSLSHGTAADFLERQSVRLNCRECHGKFEGFPAWELIGGKLKPEYAAAFIEGSIPKKPRPWLDARMPAFPAYAPLLGLGLATAHGLPPKSKPDPVSEGNLAAIGRKLVSVNGGFSCVSCHAAGDFAATQVFEAPGINLAQSFTRVQPDYFRRWVRSPISLDPTTKMPVYFDEEGKSPLSDVLDGDGPKTLQAIWEYLRAGEKMAKPE